MRVVLHLALPLLVAASALAQPQYQMTVIGGPSSPASGPVSLPLDINNAGRVVGYSHSGPNFHAFNWQTGSFTGLSGLSAFTRTYANSVNAAGRAVGAGYRLNTSTNILESRALRWTGGLMTDLGTLGGTSAAALAINDLNQIVGYSTTPGDLQTRAFLYQNGSMSSLPSLPGAVETIAYDISSTGYIAGTAVTSAPARPLLWHNGQVAQLPIPAGARTGAANAVNNAGVAVGTVELNQYTGSFAAAMWVNGALTNLGNLGGPTPYAAANDINVHSQVVGTSLDPTGLSGFLWQFGRMYSLSSLVLNHPGLRIASASAINDYGQIAAAALIDGRQTAVLLTPIAPNVPAPGTLPLLLTAGLLATRRRR